MKRHTNEKYILNLSASLVWGSLWLKSNVTADPEAVGLEPLTLSTALKPSAIEHCSIPELQI